MNVWVVIDRYDHSETTTSVHMTEKGAYIQAWQILLESWENIMNGGFADDEDLVEDYPDVADFLKSYDNDIERAKLSELQRHLSDFACYIGESSDWICDVSIDANRLRA